MFYDAHRAAGVPMPMRWSWKRMDEAMFGANVFGDSGDMKFLEIVTTPRPGDIVGFAVPGSEEERGQGHVTLYVGGQVLIYAGGNDVKIGTVKQNQEGHKPRTARTHKRNRKAAGGGSW